MTQTIFKPAIVAEITRRFDITRNLLGWSVARCEGFALGLQRAAAKEQFSVPYFAVDPDEDFFAGMEQTLPAVKLREIGLSDAYNAYSSFLLVRDTKWDQASMLRDTSGWYDSEACDFSLEEAAFQFDPNYPVENFLLINPLETRQDWVRWIADEHQDHLEEGRSGFTDLLLEQHHTPLSIVDNGDGIAPDIFDGWHRAAANVVTDRATVQAIRVSRSMGHLPDIRSNGIR